MATIPIWKYIEFQWVLLYGYKSKRRMEVRRFDHLVVSFGTLGNTRVIDSFSGTSLLRKKLPLCSSVTRCATKRKDSK
jgi:hypothetical protein